MLNCVVALNIDDGGDDALLGCRRSEVPIGKSSACRIEKQSSDGDNGLQLSLVPTSSSPASSSFASASVLASSSPSSSEFNTRLNNLLSSHNANLSPEEIVEASKLAASAAVKAAESARVAAEEKAALAAKAVAAAKSALDLVASFSEEANCRKDEELARKLHRAINSSPRISKNSPSSDLKGHKHKRPKILSTSEKLKSNGGMLLEQSPAAASNGHAVAGQLDSEGAIRESYKNKADEKPYGYDKTGQLEIYYGEAESSQTNERTWDDTSPTANPKEESDTRNVPLADMNIGNPTAGSMPLFSMEPSSEGVMPIEATSVWKCQEFKAHTCVKQNKVMQS
ncbi:hypothetical protein FNV43_RR18536 [Rhamnella rubrinervis]|uniref:Uncharacterized protein n=1 Tax=Rhamnella rubrinervis TaxID=2594499 RepID=A0A8K0DZ60_9ROSA|nr:hypothetical protein FNV43_RR18536 [Rhamnella rubrinervis]